MGDSLMDAGAARVAQQTDPRKVRILLAGRLVWSEVWDNNPRIARPDEQFNNQIIYGRDPVTNMRPYHKAKSDRQWTYNLDFRPQVGEIYFTDAEQRFAHSYRPQIVIEPHIKPTASPNKRWPWQQWQEFSRLARVAGFNLYQLGPRGTRILEGARLIETPSFRKACAVLARAKAFVGVEGGSMHAAAALGVRGVVIFGGFTPIELTGYPHLHRTLGASLGDACGYRIPCNHCAEWSKRITPEMVLANLKEVLK